MCDLDESSNFSDLIRLVQGVPCYRKHNQTTITGLAM